jgi:diguanylate cyclase (GGDEF)-like protein
MKKFRSAVDFVGGTSLCLVAAALLAVVLSPISPVAMLAAGIVMLGGALFFSLQRSLPQTKDLQTLSNVLVDRTEQVQQLTMELQELSLIDPLTGARNRRGFINLVEHQMRVAARAWNKVHFLFVDIDGMKLINDLYGHAAGDSALNTVVEILWASSRTVDIVGRMGDDEFAVALLNAEDPSVIASRIKAAVSGRCRTHDHPYELHVTIGIATFDPAAPVSLEDLLRTADAAIAEEKRASALARINGLTAPVIL